MEKVAKAPIKNSLLPTLKNKIEERFGMPVSYTFQCLPLQKSIQNVTGEILSLSTLKRVMGLVANTHLPRRSTLDILARYVGYTDIAALENEEGYGNITSEFTDIDGIEAADLHVDTEIILHYNPDRKLRLKYCGEGWFKVLSSRNSKLNMGDRLKINQLLKGFELYISEVVRDGTSLGPYVGAKQGGIIYLRKR